MDIVLTVLLDFTVVSRSFCGLEKMNTMLLGTCCCASLGLGFCFDSRRESDFMHTVFPGVVDGVIHMITVVSLSPHCSVSGVGLVLALAFLINFPHGF